VQTPIYIRIRRADGKWHYSPVAKAGNRKIRPLYALVDGKAEHHPEGDYNLRVTVGGKRKWLSVGKDPAAAMAAALRQEAKALDGINPGPAPFILMPPSGTGSDACDAQSPRNDLDEAIASYLAEAKMGKAHRTYLVYKHTLEAFREVCTAPTVEGIRREDVLAYLESRKETGNTKRTISNHVMHLRTFCNHFGVKLPLKKTDRSFYKYTEKAVQAYSRADLDALFDAADREDYELFQFFLVTGGRDQDVQAAAWPDIEWGRHRFNITEKLDIEYTPKDKEEAAIPLPADAIEMLRERRKRYPKSRLIFGLGEKGTIRDGHFLRRLKLLARRAGLNCGFCVNKEGQCCDRHPVCEKWILHRFRKTFATMHHENGISARRIQKWLRHSDLETTLKYLAGSDDDTEEMQAKINSTFAARKRGPVFVAA
jgi:integrase/recombinase XerD